VCRCKVCVWLYTLSRLPCLQGMFVCLRTEVVVKEEEEMVVAADEEMEEEEMEEEVVCERWDHTASHTFTSTRERGAEIGRYTVGLRSVRVEFETQSLRRT
jgi:hypothetical protein